MNKETISLKNFIEENKKRNMTLTVEPVWEFIYSKKKNRRNNQVNWELSRKEAYDNSG
jgi:hypothetical protein